MDKMKAQLALVKQHSFWVMCVGILIVCLVSWYMSTKAINAERAKQLADIKSVFDGLTSIRSANPKHPNPSTEQGMDALNRAYSEEVLAAWQKQYERQVDVLVWPPSFREDAAFMAQVENKRPIEVVPFPTPITSDIDSDARQLYRDYIAQEIPQLADIIGAKWVAVASASTGTDAGGYGDAGGALGSAFGGMPGRGAMGAPGGFPGGGGAAFPGGSGYPGAGSDGSVTGVPFEDDSIVLWAPDNQQQLFNTHFGFVPRETPPTTLEVLYAQEDLWVLENIMQLIRAANAGATARHEAAIKQIDFVRLGRSAVGLAGMISPVGGGAMAGMEGGMPGGMMMGAPGGMSSAMGASAGATAAGSPETGSADGAAGVPVGGKSAGMDMMMGAGGAGVAIDPALGRYVDDKYQVLDPAKLRSAHTSQNKEDALLAVAKRMPVRLRFRIDQRRMSKVLAECANAKLPVEVRQVRLNRPPAAMGGDGGGYGGGYGSGDMAGGYGGYGGSGDMPGAMGGMTRGGGRMAMPGGADTGSDDGGYASAGYGGYGGAGAYGGMGGVGGMPGAGQRAVGGANSTAAVDYNLVDVELYGIVYIYNPPNRAQLGMEPATTAGTTPPAASPTVTTPVSEPPAPAVTPTTPTSAPATPATAAATPPAAILPSVGAAQ
jgi:hypothetical protein